MRKILLWATVLAVLGVVNGMILKKENTLAHGRTMLLRLAPVDPRSLIQGDYMLLAYAMAGTIPAAQMKDKGWIVVSLDQNDVATFIRFYQGERLKDEEHLLFYRNRGRLRLGAESFMFQEGESTLYAGARYGELRVDASGNCVLVGLRGEDFKPLGKKQQTDQK